MAMTGLVNQPNTVAMLLFAPINGFAQVRTLVRGCFIANDQSMSVLTLSLDDIDESCL